MMIPVEFPLCAQVLSQTDLSTFFWSDARALFERIIQLFPPERARPIWERWARYEYQFGNLQAAQNLEKRMAETYPNGAWFPPLRS